MEHILEIKKIINGGLGLGHLPDGMVVMTNNALPGETVRVKEKKRTNKYLFADSIEILIPSIHRVAPPCPHYSECGGCNMQHIEYGYQLEIKQTLLLETLQRNQVTITPEKVAPTIASPNPFSYRHRIRLHINRQGFLGFHTAGSNSIVPINRCLLATENINERLQQFQQKHLHTIAASEFKSIELIECPKTNQITLVLHPRQKDSKLSFPCSLFSAADNVEIKNKDAVTNAGRATSLTPLKQHFQHPDSDYELSWDSHCFFQVNAKQNQQLVTISIDELQGTASTLLDLYCGTGNFSLPAAKMGYDVIGIEHNQRSIFWANINKNKLNLNGKATFHSKAVATSVDQFLQEGLTFQAIILDPPRQGLEKHTAENLSKLKSEKIIYISCDPATLARDLSIICNKGYSISKAVPIDMFPQTHHIESFVVLEKN